MSAIKRTLLKWLLAKFGVHPSDKILGFIFKYADILLDLATDLISLFGEQQAVELLKELSALPKTQFKTAVRQMQTTVYQLKKEIQ